MSGAQDDLRRAMDAAGITDPELRAGIAAIAGGESGFAPQTETGYSHTDNERIRAVFGARVADLSDAQLDALKASDEQFFNVVYGGAWGGHFLGNTQDGDGYLFRGRGLFQLTGRSNYTHFGRIIGVDLTAKPDAANEPVFAARIAVAYITERYHGGGWEAMKRAVGNAVASTETVKDQLYAQYLASGEFAFRPGAVPVPTPSTLTPPVPVVAARPSFSITLAENTRLRAALASVIADAQAALAGPSPADNSADELNAERLAHME